MKTNKKSAHFSLQTDKQCIIIYISSSSEPVQYQSLDHSGTTLSNQQIVKGKRKRRRDFLISGPFHFFFNFMCDIGDHSTKGFVGSIRFIPLPLKSENGFIVIAWVLNCGLLKGCPSCYPEQNYANLIAFQNKIGILVLVSVMRPKFD